jgi:hypothetical protein
MASEIWSHAKTGRLIATVATAYWALSIIRDEWPLWFDDKVPWVSTPLSWAADLVPPWLILVVAIAAALIATFEWSYVEVWRLRNERDAEPRPNVVYDGIWQRETPLDVRVPGGTSIGASSVSFGTVIPSGPELRATSVETIRHHAWFQGPTFINRHTAAHPLSDAERVHARTHFYNPDGSLFLDIATARWPKNEEHHQVPSARYIETTELPVGVPTSLDLLMRLKGTQIAYAWRNDGRLDMEQQFLPGESYCATVELNSASFRTPFTFVFDIQIPWDAAQPISIRQRELAPST